MEKAMRFSRKDDGPTRVVGQYTVYDEEKKRNVIRKIRIHTGPRKALQCR